MKNSYVTVVLALLCHIASAQEVLTRNTQNQKLASPGKARKLKAAAPALRLRKIDVTSLLEEDKREAAHGLPLRFGNIVPLALDTRTAGTWESVEGGKVWQFALTSPGAFSLNFLFDKFYLPEGAELYLYNSDRSIVMGPITAAQNNKARVYATDLLKGDFVTFELFEPATATGQSILHVAQAVHGYRNLFSRPYAGNSYGESASCNVDINCPAGNGWQAESNAVAMVITGNYVGTGTLLNDACQSLTPYFLTAFHILNGNTQNWVFRFQYKSPTCGGADGTSYLSLSGAQLVASYEPSDFALLRLNQRPSAASGITYAGWSRVPTAPTSAAAIHHPAGDVMKISLSNSPAQVIQNNFWRADFTVGTTQPGSSGGPLFSQDHRVVGQLYGDRTPDGSDYCTRHRGDYGRFDVSWNGGGTPQTRLRDWLTTDPNVVQVNTVEIPNLTGPDVVCNQTATFRINSPNASWSASPAYLFATTAGSGGQFSTTAAPGMQGTGTIAVTLPGACNPITKTVRVGTEPSGYFYSGNFSGRLQTVQFITPGQVSLFMNEPYTFNFTSSSSSVYLSNRSGSSTSFYLGSNGVQITATAIGSDCGMVGNYVFAIQSRLMAAPNPAVADLTVTLDNPASAFAADNASLAAAIDGPTAPLDVDLYDSFGRKVRTQRGAHGKAVFDVRNLPNGLYELRSGTGKKALSEHIQIAH